MWWQLYLALWLAPFEAMWTPRELPPIEPKPAPEPERPKLKLVVSDR